MISKELANKLSKLSVSGSMYLLNKGEQSFNFQDRLRDFTDKDILKIIKEKNTYSVAQLFYWCEHSTNDKDVKAHIYGYESDDAFKKAFKEMIEETVTSTI